MKRAICTLCLATATFLGGWYVGFVGESQEKDLKKTVSQQNWDRETSSSIEIPPDEWGYGDFEAAQKYADWCGGKVEDAPGGPYVVDCDQ